MDDMEWSVPCCQCGGAPTIETVTRRSKGTISDWRIAQCDGCGMTIGDFRSESMARKAWMVSNSVIVPMAWREYGREAW